MATPKELQALLRSVRADKDSGVPRGVAADWLREHGGDEAAEALVARRCQRCRVPENRRGAFDRHGQWHDERAIDNMNSDYGMELFGCDYPDIFDIFDGFDCDAHRGGDGAYWWVCVTCRRSLVAAKAAATRKARRAARQDALSLFSDAVE